MFELTLPFNLAASMNLGITLPLALLNRATTKDIVMTCALYFLHKLSQYVILSMVFLNWMILFESQKEEVNAGEKSINMF